MSTSDQKTATIFAPLDQSAEIRFDDIININLKGVFFRLQKLLPLLEDIYSVI